MKRLKECQLRRENYDEVIDLCNLALQCDPKFAKAHYRKAKALQQLGKSHKKYRGVVILFPSMLVKEHLNFKVQHVFRLPQISDIACNLASRFTSNSLCLCRIGQIEEAKSSLKELLHHDPSHKLANQLLHDLT